ncbi:hypothetical protein [Paenibacillus lentus]|uniref:hypothetical protein n=1 Tax=Paenibacillus lentus TaxID=1338368 RepID=UPI0036D40622
MRIRQYLAYKKITLIVVLLILLLTGSIFLNFKLFKFKETQQNGYAQRISHAFSQLNLSINQIDLLIQRLENGTSPENTISLLGDLEVSLSSAGDSFRLLDHDFMHYEASTYIIYSTLADFYRYVKADLTDGILLHEKDFKAAEMIAGLEILRDDLSSFTHPFDESKLAGYDPGWIKLEWKKSLQEAIRNHPDFILHQRLSMKYVL